MEISSNINNLKMDTVRGKHLLVKFAPALLTAILVFLIASKLVSATWLLLDKPQYDAQPSAISGPSKGAATTDYQQAIESIRSAHLFGKYVEEEIPTDAATEVVEAPIPETTVRDLTLKGTVASTSDDNGLAIVEYKGEENVYTIGETIGAGISLKRVLATEIHLSRGGVTEKLALPKIADTPQSTRSNNRSNNRDNNRTTNNRNRQTASRAVESASSRASIPAKLGDLLRPQPVFQNGKQLGYRVYPGRKREQFKALGLKAGDLVTEINGSPLDDPSRGLEIFRSLNDSTQVSVTVQRNGAQTSLVLDTSQLNDPSEN